MSYLEFIGDYGRLMLKDCVVQTGFFRKTYFANITNSTYGLGTYPHDVRIHDEGGDDIRVKGENIGILSPGIEKKNLAFYGVERNVTVDNFTGSLHAPGSVTTTLFNFAYGLSRIRKKGKVITPSEIILEERINDRKLEHGDVISVGNDRYIRFHRGDIRTSLSGYQKVGEYAYTQLEKVE